MEAADDRTGHDGWKTTNDTWRAPVDRMTGGQQGCHIQKFAVIPNTQYRIRLFESNYL